MHKPDLYMLWYPLLAEFEHVRDIHYAAYQSLSLSLLKAAQSESVRAREGWVNAEPPTPKKHQSCREFLNISEGKNEDSQSEPKWQVEPWRTLVAVKSCSVGATNWHAALRMQPKVRRSIVLHRAPYRSASTRTRRPREAWTRSNKIKQDQEKSRLNSGFTTGMPVPEVNVPENVVRPFLRLQMTLRFMPPARILSTPVTQCRTFLVFWTRLSILLVCR